MNLEMKTPSHRSFGRTAFLALALSAVASGEEGPLAEYMARAEVQKASLKALEKQKESTSKLAQQNFDSKLNQLKQQQKEQVEAARNVLASMEARKESALREMQARHDLEIANEDQESTYFDSRQASEEANAQTNLDNALRNLPSGVAGRVEEQNRRSDYSRALSELRRSKEARRELLSKNRTRRYSEKRKTEEVWDKSISTQRTAVWKAETSWAERIATEERNYRSQSYTTETNQDQEIARMAVAIERGRYEAERQQEAWDRVHPGLVDEMEQPMDRKRLKVARYDAVGKYAAPEAVNTAARTVATGPGSRMASVQLSNGQVLLIPDWAEWYWVRDQVLLVSVAHPKEITAHRLMLKDGPKAAAVEWNETLNAVRSKWLKERSGQAREQLIADLATFSESTKGRLREKLGNELAERVQTQLIAAITSEALKAKSELEGWQAEMDTFLGSLPGAEQEIQKRKIDWQGKRIGNLSSSELEERFRSAYYPERIKLSEAENAWEKKWQAYLVSSGRSLPQWEEQAARAAEQTLTMSDRIKSFHTDLAQWREAVDAQVDEGEKARQEYQNRFAAIGTNLSQTAFPEGIPKDLSARLQNDSEVAVRTWKTGIESHRARLDEKNKALQAALDSYSSDLILRLVDGAAFEDLRAGWEEKVSMLRAERAAFESEFLQSFGPLRALLNDLEGVDTAAQRTIEQHRTHSALRLAIEKHGKHRDQAHAAMMEQFETDWVAGWHAPIVSLYVEKFGTDGSAELQALVRTHFGNKVAEHFSRPVEERWKNHPAGIVRRKEITREWELAIQSERSRRLATYAEGKAADQKTEKECGSLPWEKSVEKLSELQALWQTRETEEKAKAVAFADRLHTEWAGLKPQWDGGPLVSEQWDEEMRSYPRVFPSRDFPPLKRGRRFDLTEYLVFQDASSKREIYLGEVGKVHEVQGLGANFAVVADWLKPSKAVKLVAGQALQESAERVGQSKEGELKVLLFRGAELVDFLLPPRPTLYFGRFLIHENRFFIPLERIATGAEHQRVRVRQVAYELDLREPKLSEAELPQEELKQVDGPPFP